MSIYDFPTLKAWQEHPEVIGRMISPDMVISLLTEHNSTITLEAFSKTNTKAAGFWLALIGSVTSYNVITGNSIGDKQQLLLSYLVSIVAVTEGFRQALIAYANPTVYPNANKTLLDFKIAKGTIERKKITLKFENGKCSIRTTADCEAHTPQIYQKVMYTNGDIEFNRVAGFRTVEKADLYRIPCPELPNLYVDDAYGVIS